MFCPRTLLRYCTGVASVFGTSQKALNLYRKILWCLGLLRMPPAHCPVDRLVILKAKIVGNWTQLDSSEEYTQWISRLRHSAEASGYNARQYWELTAYNQ